MATTSNTYTGNGTNKLFLISFSIGSNGLPYLDTTDVDVYLNGTLQTLTTQYSFANATTIEFTTAPANGAVVFIERTTSDVDLQSTFFAGSSIKAADLNLNFDQLLYLLQEIKVNSNNESFYIGALAADPLTRLNGDALQTGDLYFNIGSQVYKTWNGTNWVATAATNGSFFRWKKTASAGNTTLSGVDDLGVTLSYSVGKEQVYLNGALQTRSIDYTATTGTSIVFSPALLAGDIVELHTITGYSLGSIAPGVVYDIHVAADAGIQSSKLAFTAAATNTITRSVNSKLQEIVSIKDYGAVGDGVTDDSNAIQAALNDSTVDTIAFPGGRYKVTKTLIFNPSSSIIGRYSTKFVGTDGFNAISTIVFTGGTNDTNYPTVISGCTAPGKVGLWLGYKFRAENMGFEFDTTGLTDDQKRLLCTVRFERTYIPLIDGESDQADMDSSLVNCNLDGGNGLNDGTTGAAAVSYIGRNMQIEGCTFVGNTTAIALKFPNTVSAPSSNPGATGNAYQGTPFGHRKNRIVNNVFHLAAESRAIAIYGNYTNHGLLVSNNTIDIGGQLLLVSGSGGLDGAVISENSCFYGDQQVTYNMLAWIQALTGTKIINSSISGNTFMGTDDTDMVALGYLSDVRRYDNSILFGTGVTVNNITINGNSFGYPIDQHIKFNSLDVSRVSITGNNFFRRTGSSAAGIFFQAATSTASTISGTTFTVGGTITGTFVAGMVLTGTGVTAGTTIVSGSGTSFVVTPSQTVASTAINSIAAGSAIVTGNTINATNLVNVPIPTNVTSANNLQIV